MTFLAVSSALAHAISCNAIRPVIKCWSDFMHLHIESTKCMKHAEGMSALTCWRACASSGQFLKVATPCAKAMRQ